MTENEFIKELNKLGINPTEEQLKQLEDYYNLLVEWNKKINLTRIIKKEDVYLKHFYDSLTIIKAIDLTNKKSLCDVGTGAGFPGIVLKIFYPNLEITLLDSKNKKILFLEEVIKKLNLKGIKAKHQRVEEYKETFDIVTSRAVANILKLINLTKNILNNNSQLIALKGNIDNELTKEITEEILKKYQIKKILKFNLPKEKSARSIILIKKK